MTIYQYTVLQVSNWRGQKKMYLADLSEEFYNIISVF